MLPSGVEGAVSLVSPRREGFYVKVSIYKAQEGEMAILVEASPGRGRAPVVLSGVTRENLTEKLEPVTEAMRRPKGWVEVAPPA